MSKRETQSASGEQGPSQPIDADRFDGFFATYYEDEVGRLISEYPRERRSIRIDHADLYRFDEVLAERYLDRPEKMREVAETALTRVPQAPITDDSLESAHVRISNAEEIELGQLRADDTGSLITFPGVVNECTEPFPEIQEAVFQCVRCNHYIGPIPQQSKKMREPNQCPSCERNGPFRYDQGRSVIADVQILVVQENPESLRGGEEPSTIAVRVEDDIVGRAVPGQQVSVTGQFCLHDPDESGKNDLRLDIYVEGHEIVVNDETFDDMEISDEEARAIAEKSNEDDIYRQMVDSVAPAIHGHDRLKEAIILQLFSGVEKHLPDGSRIRGDVHVLAIGDPGTGKSQILQHMREISPRAVYSQGGGSSAAGLTAACVKGEIDDGFVVKAGTLVMADRGIAAVDELDKMDNDDRASMHEGLEQGEVTVSKAGMNTTLKSRCALLAAANPKHGRFDRYESIAEQIDLEPALISRFDLIFIVQDNPDPEEDGELADHILQSNYAGELYTSTTDLGHGGATASEVDADIEAEADAVSPAIDPELLRKYIAHSKQTCTPRLTADARAELRDFYVDLRSHGIDEDAPVPVTARKLEALVRLAEASARVRFSEEVTVDDAERAIRVVQQTLSDVGMDPETGEYDIDVVETGTSKSQRDRIRDITDLIAEMAADTEKGVPMDELLDEAEERGMERSKAEHEIEKLRRQGDVYEPNTDHLRVT